MDETDHKERARDEMFDEEGTDDDEMIAFVAASAAESVSGSHSGQIYEEEEAYVREQEPQQDQHHPDEHSLFGSSLVEAALAASIAGDDATVATIRTEATQETETTTVENEICPQPQDVLSGRGAATNSHCGNKAFRALCFSHKAEFDAANQAAKKRLASRIVDGLIANHGTRFLVQQVRKPPPGPKSGKKTQVLHSWVLMTRQQAIRKTSQTIRDYKRDDRKELHARRAASTRKRSSQATPMEDVVEVTPPGPIVETPEGVHVHDVLSGRGAFITGHVGNERLRRLARERKQEFDSAGPAEKRVLAMEIVDAIRALDPPGRFLRKVNNEDCTSHNNITQNEWDELPETKAIDKTCQVMRDLDRKDRIDREERKELKMMRKQLQQRQQNANNNDESTD